MQAHLFKRSILVVLLYLLPFQLIAQEHQYDSIEKYIDYLERNDLGMGTLSIYQDGKPAFKQSFGFRNIEKQTKNNPTTHYRIGSISKTMTAAMIMQTIEEGKLRLNTKLSKFYPQLNDAKKITIGHLLSHRSGFKEIVRQEGLEKWLESPQTQNDMLKAFVKMGSDFKPDEKQEYNNNGYVLLSYILEKIDGKPFAEILNDRIIKPNNLNNTYYGKKMGEQRNEAISYQDNSGWELSTSIDHNNPLGAGGVVSTPDDLNVFMNNLFNHKIVSKKSLQKMLPPEDPELYGFGLMHYQLGDVKAYGHTGGIDGYRSWLLYVPAMNTTIAYSTNAQKTAFKEVVNQAFKRYNKALAQIKLTETIYQEDQRVFDAFFHQPNMDYLSKKMMPDFEFYHDKGGLTHTDSAAFIKDFQRIWKKQESGEKKRSRRELVKDSLMVYPMNNYGAVQVADHLFYEKQDDGTELLMDEAKIIHLWKDTEDGWKLSRIVSYDHQHVNRSTFQINSELETEIQGMLKKYNTPTVGVGLINNGKITYSKTFGTQSDGQTASNETFFKVASITKPLAALVVYKMVDLGLWDLDEPLHKYWVDPEIADDPRTKLLTTKMVIDQESGFPNWRFQTESGKLQFLFEPGEKHGYSGEGFDYVMRSIEKKFNKPFEEIAKRILFDKQDMDSIHFWWDDSINENQYAENYSKKGEKYDTYKYYEASAAGNILATVDDYLKFGAHMLEGAGISNTLFAQLMTPAKTSMYKDLVKYGDGWVHLKLSTGEKVIWHDGRDPGVRTLILLFPDTNQGLVVLTNGDDGDKLYTELLSKLAPRPKDFIDTVNTTKAAAIAEMKKAKAAKAARKGK